MKGLDQPSQAFNRHANLIKESLRVCKEGIDSSSLASLPIPSIEPSDMGHPTGPYIPPGLSEAAIRQQVANIFLEGAVLYL
jgi:hypothetical protein